MAALATNIDPLHLDSKQSARKAGLRFYTDDRPGIRRKRAGKGFAYVDDISGPVRDRDTLARIETLAIPPAWTDVWISPHENGHIQATGRDGRGRKQHRYHADWRAFRDEVKYERMIAFGKALPAIRKQVDEHLGRRGMPREKVLATIVKLLETSLIRVGNEEYVKANDSYGLTTMHNEHVDVTGAQVQFHFKGKSNKMHEISVQDRRLAAIVRKLQDLPGEELFQYVDENAEPQTVDSSDVNEYIRGIAGDDFTAKDFRTWAGTVLAALALKELQTFTSEREAKSNIVKAVKEVAQRLGNTPTICRRCYVHPVVFETYLRGGMLDTLRHEAEQTLSDEISELDPEEAAVLALIRQKIEDR